MMLNLKAELRSADQSVGSLLESLSNVSDKLSMLENDTKGIRTRTSQLHAAKAGITTALTRMDNISAHFKTADDMSGRLSLGFDAEALHQVSDSIDFLNGQLQWLSSDATIRRLYELQEKARKAGLDRLKELWKMSAPTIEGDLVGGAKLDSASIDEAKTIIECLIDTGDERPLKEFGLVRGESMKAALSTLFAGSRDGFLAPSSPYSPGSHPFTRFAHVTLRLLQQERLYCESLLDRPEHNTAVFEASCELSVALLNECGAKSTALVLADGAWAGVEGLGFTVLVDLAASYSKIHGELVALCQPRGMATKSSGALKSLSGHLRVEALKCLAAVLEDVEHDDTTIPATATVSVLTSNTLRAVRRLCSIENQYLSLVQDSSYETDLANSSSSSSSSGSGSGPKSPLSTKVKKAIIGSWSVDPFIVLLVDELVGALARKQVDGGGASGSGSGSSSNPKQQSAMVLAFSLAKKELFVVNNLSYIIAGLKGRVASGDDGLYDQVASLQRKFETKVQEFCKVGWSEILKRVGPIPAGTLIYAKGKISFESGRVLKARFDSFNLELEEYVTALGSLSVPDAALREQLRDGITYYFVPVCKKFFDAYAEVQFSKKHQEEYLRNSPKVLETKIGELFL